MSPTKSTSDDGSQENVRTNKDWHEASKEAPKPNTPPMSTSKK